MLVLVSVDGLATHIGYNQDNDDQATQACLNIVANAHGHTPIWQSASGDLPVSRFHLPPSFCL